MKKKTLSLLTIISFLLLATLGVSVAFFSALRQGEKIVSITTGGITFKYTEVSGIGNGINYSDASPLSDSEGKKLDKYFDFKIEANLMQADMIYEVNVEAVENNLPLEGIKIYITELRGNKEVKINSNFNGLGKVKTLANYSNGIIYQERIFKNTKNYEKNFRVRIWVDEEADIYTDQFMGKSGGFRINVNAISNQTMVDSTLPVPVITGGTGTTWTMDLQTIEVVNTNPPLGGVVYEYYVAHSATDIPDDLTIATDTTDNYYEASIIGKNYIYYRTVAANNLKSAWSSPQIVFYDNNTYTITYNLNGGSQGLNPVNSYTVLTETFNLPEPTKTGYIFAGWYDNASFTGNSVSSVPNGTRGNKVFYAKWVRLTSKMLEYENSLTNCKDVECAINELFDVS